MIASDRMSSNTYDLDFTNETYAINFIDCGHKGTDAREHYAYKRRTLNTEQSGSILS